MFCFSDLKNMVFGVICLFLTIVSNLFIAYLWFAAPPDNLWQFPSQLLGSWCWVLCFHILQLSNQPIKGLPEDCCFPGLHLSLGLLFCCFYFLKMLHPAGSWLKNLQCPGHSAWKCFRTHWLLFPSNLLISHKPSALLNWSLSSLFFSSTKYQ